MTDKHERPMAALGETVPRHSAIIRRQPIDLDSEIQRMSLREMIADIVKLKALHLAGQLARRIEARPMTAILIAMGLGLLSGGLLRHTVLSPRR
jgi:hypothetical protein